MVRQPRSGPQTIASSDRLVDLVVHGRRDGCSESVVNMQQGAGMTSLLVW